MEKSWNFVSPEKWEPWSFTALNMCLSILDLGPWFLICTNTSGKVYYIFVRDFDIRCVTYSSIIGHISDSPAGLSTDYARLGYCQDCSVTWKGYTRHCLFVSVIMLNWFGTGSLCYHVRILLLLLPWGTDICY